jgi:hypothetical protein
MVEAFEDGNKRMVDNTQSGRLRIAVIDVNTDKMNNCWRTGDHH